MAQRYVGLRVEWDTRLRFAEPRDDGLVWLILQAEPPETYFNVDCMVKLDDFKILGVLPEGAQIRIGGTIAEATGYGVVLEDVYLHFLGAPTS